MPTCVFVGAPFHPGGIVAPAAWPGVHSTTLTRPAEPAKLCLIAKQLPFGDDLDCRRRGYARTR